MLKVTIDDLVEAPGNLRDEYKKGDDGKYHLQLDGESARVKEFRENNIALSRERDGLKVQLAELQGKPDGSKELEAQLVAERTAHSATKLKSIVSAEFLYAGGRASAVDFIASEAAKVFSVDGDAVVTKEFSAANPAEPLSVKEWIAKKATELDYCFQPSRGGSAGSNRSGSVQFGSRSNVKILKNPTPQDLGANAVAIAKGDIKVEYK